MLLWEQNDVEAAQQAIRNEANVNCINSFGGREETPLTFACGRGYDGIVRILLQAGADARGVGRRGHGLSPMVIACRLGYLSIVEMLLNHDNGILEIMCPRFGLTPLLLAIWNRQFEIIHYFVGLRRECFGDHPRRVDNSSACMYGRGGSGYCAAVAGRWC